MIDQSTGVCIYILLHFDDDMLVMFIHVSLLGENTEQHRTLSSCTYTDMRNVQ